MGLSRNKVAVSEGAAGSPPFYGERGRVERSKYRTYLLFNFEWPTKETLMKLVPLTHRVHPYPYRTRKLSCVVPTILARRRAGKIGRGQHPEREKQRNRRNTGV